MRIRPKLDPQPIPYFVNQTVTEVLKDPNDKLIAVDMDGTLVAGEVWNDEDPEPVPQMVELVQDLYARGAHIVIWTARKPNMYPQTMAWLIKHEVPFHGIGMQVKLGCDLFIDDKCVRPEEL
jgi:uncharacterized HAD superfamily protein